MDINSEASQRKISALKQRLIKLKELLQAKAMVKYVRQEHLDDTETEFLEMARNFIIKHIELHKALSLAEIEEDKKEKFEGYLKKINGYNEKLMDKLEKQLEFLESKTWLRKTKGMGVTEVIGDLHEATKRFMKEAKNQTQAADSASATEYIFEGEDLSDLESISGGAFANKYSSEGVFKGVVVGEFESAMLESIRAVYGGGRRGGCGGATSSEH